MIINNPPANLYFEEAEACVLGSLIYNPYNCHQVFTKLTVHDFYSEKHQSIFKALQTLYEDSTTVDVTILQDYLIKQTFWKESADVFHYLNYLIENFIDSDVLLKEYVDILMDRSIKRKLKLGIKFIETQVNSTMPISEVLTNVHDYFQKLIEDTKIESYDFISDKIETLQEQLKLWEASSYEFIGLGSGIAKLDRLTAGFQKGNLIILAARPSMGKTTLSLNFVINAVQLDLDNVVVFFSLETSYDQILEKILQITSKINISSVKYGKKLTTGQWNQITITSENLKQTKIIIVDDPTITLSKINIFLKQLATKHDISLVVIDYLQLLSIDKTDYMDRNREISFMSRKLKQLSRSLAIPIICLSQLSRYVERRENKKPIMSDLRDSGAIEQDADLIMFLYRPGYYHKDTQADDNYQDDQTKQENFDPNFTELILAKNRNGTVGNVDLYFNQETGVFKDYEASFDDDFWLKHHQ